MNITLRLAIVFACLFPMDDAGGQEESPQLILGFETEQLAGWTGFPDGTYSQDSITVHAGHYSGRLHRGSESGEMGSALSASIPRTFAGEEIVLRGWLRTEDVTGWAGLWLRQDGRSGMLEVGDMESQKLAGTTDWKEYRVTLPLHGGARTIVVGAVLVGEGIVWADDLEILVDGKPMEEAPPFVSVTPPAELDKEFDEGSRIAVPALSAVGIESLGRLGKIWGFVKYHHPAVRAGYVNWDYELFRVLPAILESTDRASANQEMDAWLSRLGIPEECDPCAQLPEELHLRPRIDWIEDKESLGSALSTKLKLIYDRRPADNEHYYLSHAPGVGNPVFSGEPSYPQHSAPDPGFRLLSLFRFWNIIEYWFPYRDLIDDPWESVLAEFVPKVLAADSEDAYRLTMIEVTARVKDTHANLWANLDLQPPRGTASLPVVLRFIQGSAVVTEYSEPTLGPATGLKIGDIIDAIDGQPVDSLVLAWSHLYSASNQPTRLRDIARKLTRGEPGPVVIEGRRAGGAFSLTADRVPFEELDRTAGRTHDLPGETFQILSEDVAYLKLSSVAVADIEGHMTQASSAEVLVVDIRNYPSEFVVFALGGRLVDEPTPFARFTAGDGENPGAFLMGPSISLQPLEPGFSGKVVVLIDEVSQSQAEYTAMALRASENTIVVGSTTAGADGNISPIPLPGGISSMISGIGVFYPDGTPTQRVGIVPDIEVVPTIEGVRAGRDEVLEAAVSHALGREFRVGH